MKEFRNEIDGLRAIAVSVVILFHAGFSWAQGGYVGVDVFFVISGFLITLGLMKTGKDTSLSSFYSRRIRRLFPALLATVLITGIASFLVMAPSDFANVAKSCIYAVISVSNIGFWLESGYWDSASHYKPLLHTWSLSVEEQFYLVWPVLVLLLSRIGKPVVLLFMLVLTVIGAIVAQYFSQSIPSSVFYLTPFRAYQFAIGGLYAAYLAVSGRSHLTDNPFLRELMIVAGLGLIFWPTFQYDGTESFYLGAMAGLPCVGALLIIAAGPGPVFGRLLVNPVAGFLGRTSYSLYLVHWPIMALYRYYIVRDFNLIEQISMIAATVILAWLLYKLVETRFRHPIVRGTRQPLSAAGFGFASTGIALLFIVVSAHGWALRSTSTVESMPAAAQADGMTPSLQVLAATDQATIRERRTSIVQSFECSGGIECVKLNTEANNIALIGDSQGPDATNVLFQVFPDVSYIPANRHIFGKGCITLFAPNQPAVKKHADCAELQERLYGDSSLLSDVDAVVLAFRFDDDKLDAFPQTLERIRDITSAPIIIFGEAFTFNDDITAILRSMRFPEGDVRIPAKYLRSNFYDRNEQVRNWAKEYGAIFLDRHAYFCPDGECRAKSKDGIELTTYDTNHLSLAAAVEYGQYLKEEGILEELEQSLDQ